MEQKTIIVTGLGRCGTSAIAGILNCLGVRMAFKPEMLSQPDIGNVKGQFEDLQMRLFNDMIIGDAGGKWWHQIPDPDAVVGIYENPDFRKAAEKLIGKRNEADLWGCKDPRFTLTYPLVHKFLRNPYVIYCGRDMSESVRSVVKAFEYGKVDIPEDAYTFWATVTCRCMNYLFSLSDPLLMLTFERMMSEPEQVAADVAAFIGQEITEEALDWIDPGLRTISTEEEDKDGQ